MTKEKKMVSKDMWEADYSNSTDPDAKVKQMAKPAEKMAYFQGEAPSSATQPVQEAISSEDKAVLEIVKLRQQVALKEAENAELSFRYTVLQIFMKYGINPNADALHDDGRIVRGELLKQKVAK